MGRWTRRGFLLAGGAALGVLGTKRYGDELPSMVGTQSLQPTDRKLYMNDASGLSQTPIKHHFITEQSSSNGLVEEIRAQLKTAQAEGQSVAVGAARHSMGGQAIPRDGRAITFEHDFLELDKAKSTYRVAAGVRWHSIIKQLDAAGYSPAVMQSNADFGVASTFCVNAHGWPVTFGPAGSTTRSLKMVLANGEHVICSRQENQELFNLVMGGYGLFGVITELEMDMVPNSRLTPTYEELPAAGYGEAMVKALKADPSIQMAYGRLNVDRGSFFDEALLITYRPTDDQGDLPEVAGSGFMSKASRHIFRGQLGNERVKNWRWYVETDVGPVLGGESTRNSLMNEPVITLDDRDPARTDILHEYFVSPDQFPAFIKACQEVISASYQELLNITLRYVAQDDESVLSYAWEPRIAAVMLFSQEMTQRGEADMARMTRDLIDRVIEIGGAYYLPYRPHATVGQLKRSYQRVGEFAEAKRRLDPGLLFRNNFWDAYVSQV